ncbi:transferase hexapeptide domain-containing protein [Histoplasma capsulatum G186AR]|uniref:Dynactin subunit 6 n=1 Tax=Ajellomyces capsulatus (strain G186AR / H82 / ATCC MYA-2454 / RMSCC 2432) TaxID=447093 RepID=C0NHB6_AJECG|nr:transferase hexapeptide domain-containing protein [Histoplasma capsulatum G186AR]EEH09201.1 transferase hexapeptide domain-containing protein [Histoplasma capsulatum G186AR]
MSANQAHRHSSSRHSSSQKPTSPSYKPPLTTHPSATISESVSFQGTHPISIGAGTVIHPRTKFISFEGPIKIGSGCIIGEKSIIGGPQTSPTPLTPTTRSIDTTTSITPTATTIVTVVENSVLIGPLVTISAGTHISSAATVDTAAILGQRVRVGQHAKVCPGCCIPDDGVVDAWVVIWGGTGSGNRLQRRKRANGQQQQHGDEAVPWFGLGGTVVEKGRLAVLEKEREGLTNLIGAVNIGGGARRK